MIGTVRLLTNRKSYIGYNFYLVSAYTDIAILSFCPSVFPSVRHVPVFYGNG